MVTKLLIYTKLNPLKLKPGLGAFHAVRTGNVSGLFHSSVGYIEERKHKMVTNVNIQQIKFIKLHQQIIETFIQLKSDCILSVLCTFYQRHQIQRVLFKPKILQALFNLSSSRNIIPCVILNCQFMPTAFTICYKYIRNVHKCNGIKQ